jgi:hypothetical protein
VRYRNLLLNNTLRQYVKTFLTQIHWYAKLLSWCALPNRFSSSCVLRVGTDYRPIWATKPLAAIEGHPTATEGNQKMSSATDHLKTELETYEQNKENLLGKEGKFVLIHGKEIAGLWDTYEDALQAGYQQFGMKPFLVKQIQGIERVQCFSRELCPP